MSEGIVYDELGSYGSRYKIGWFSSDTSDYDDTIFISGKGLIDLKNIHNGELIFKVADGYTLYKDLPEIDLSKFIIEMNHAWGKPGMVSECLNRVLNTKLNEEEKNRVKRGLFKIIRDNEDFNNVKDYIIDKNTVIMDITDRNYAKFKIGDGETKYDELLYVSKNDALLCSKKYNYSIGYDMINSAIQIPQLIIRYHHDKYPDLPCAVQKGNFIDLYAAEEYTLKKGEFKLINLGISVQIPDGYWLQLVPRSSTFKNYKVIQTNSFGVVDTTYCGDDDIVMMPVYAMEDTVIKANERICQFTLQKDVKFRVSNTDEPLQGPNRGGFGSTGKG